MNPDSTTSSPSSSTRPASRRSRMRLVRWTLSAFFALVSLILLAAALGPPLTGSDRTGRIPPATPAKDATSSRAPLAVPGWQSLSGNQIVDESDDSSDSSAATATTKAPAPGIDPEKAGDPERVVIPSIEVDSRLVPVGLKADGTMETPDFGMAAWYDLGPKPGAVGSAVIVAHVDSKKGPDVFYRLRELQVGDQIQVTYPSGLQATFSVEGREQIAKSELPVDRIWIQTEAPVLRLITCGGEFDRSTGHYRSNVIVYASFVSGG